MKTHIEFKRYINNDPFQRKEIRFYSDGTKQWFLNGNYHREDVPAHIGRDGSKCWFLNGNRHREDGPALTYSNGYKEWWLNGKLHREDGPACEWNDGSKEWYLEGKEYRYEKEYWEALRKYKMNMNKTNK